MGTLTDVDDDIALKNWLAVLTPLTLPQVSETIADPMGTLQKDVPMGDPVLAALLAAAPQGAERVQAEFHRLVREPLDRAEIDDE